jgi:hypothetical protein
VFAHCPAGFYDEASTARLNVGAWLGNESVAFKQIKKKEALHLLKNLQIYSNIFTSKENISSNEFVGIYDDLPELEGDNDFNLS